MIKLNDDEQAGYDILAPHMPADLAIDIIKHRRAKKAKLTARVARMLLNEYKAFGNIEKAAETHLMRAWTGFQADWVKQPSRYTDQNHPTPRPAANYGSPKQEEEPRAVVSAERRAELAALARQTAGKLRALQ